MERYIVKESDLIGDIENLPIGLVQLMVDYQFIQGNKPDVEVFQSCKTTDKYDGGFNWDTTIEGLDWWKEMFDDDDFHNFYQKYGHNKYYIYQDGTIRGEDVINTLESYGADDVIGLEGTNEGYIYYITPEMTINYCEKHSSEYCLVMLAGYQEAKIEQKIVEYTLEEIAEKLGVDVNYIRIKN